MPNIFVQRYFIFGKPTIIDQIMKKYFYIADQKQFPYFHGNGPLWLSQGLMEEDPLINQIANSGDFVRQKNHIAFSSYMGLDMHPELIEEMARQLPKGTIVLVIGFDMDDYPNPTGGQILEVEGGTGRRIQYQTYPSEWIARYHFPVLYQELSE